MAGRTLKALAAALAAAGALATSGVDEVSLIQQESSSEARAQAAQAMTAVLTSMVGNLELHGALAQELGARASGTGDGKCTTADRANVKVKAQSLMKKIKDNGPQSLAAEVPASCEKLAKSKSVVPDLEGMRSCMGSLLDVSPACSACPLDYVQGMSRFFGGCIGNCLPVAGKCQSLVPGSEPSEDCQKTLKDCMKCSQPHFKKMTQCLGSSPDEPDLVQMLDHVQDEILQGSQTFGGGAKEFFAEGVKLTKVLAQ